MHHSVPLCTAVYLYIPLCASLYLSVPLCTPLYRCVPYLVGPLGVSVELCLLQSAGGVCGAACLAARTLDAVPPAGRHPAQTHAVDVVPGDRAQRVTGQCDTAGTE